MRRARVLLAAAVATIAFARHARADERAECAHAFEQTQRFQQDREMLDALDDAERCARPSCPAVLQQECARWVGEIRGKVATLKVRVRGSDACTADQARVDVGGRHRKTNNGVLLDPGRHEIVATEPSNGRTKTETIDFASGERREIDIDFAPPGAVCGGGAEPTPSRLPPTPALILGAVGGGLLLAGATAGIIGAVKRGDLDDCKPNCSSDRIDPVRTFFVAGDVMGGFGLLALGTAAAIWILAKPAGAPKAATPPFVVRF
jgi:hypothetical protein